MTCTQDGRVEGCVPIFSRENSKIVTNRWTVECQIPPKKDTLCPRSKEKPQQDGRRGEIVFRIITHICQRCSQSSNITFCTAGPRDPTRDWARPAFEHLSVSWGDTGQLWPSMGTGALAAANLCQLQIGTYQEHCQQLNKGICCLPLQSLNPVLL